MKILSIDVAIKSLAISLVDGISINKEDQGNDLIWKDINVLKNWTIDLIPGKKIADISIMERINKTSDFLEHEIIPLLKEDSSIIILVEEQLKTTPTYVSYITILTVLRHHTIKIRGGSIKNRLSIGGIRHEMAYTKTIDKYRANKEHCRMMFLHIKDKLGGAPIIYDKKMETDLADTYIQTMSFLLGF